MSCIVLPFVTSDFTLAYKESEIQLEEQSLALDLINFSRPDFWASLGRFFGLRFFYSGQAKNDRPDLSRIACSFWSKIAGFGHKILARILAQTDH